MHGRTQAEVTEKKCTSTCGKMKPADEFWQDQGACKLCVMNNRKLQRRASASGQKEWLDELKGNDPNEFRKLEKQFAKHVSESKDPKHFCLLTYKRKLTLRSGVKASGRKKWMWKGNF